MDFSDLFKQAVGFLDMLKPETLEKLGPFGHGVALTGQAVAAAFALLAFSYGRSRWTPATPKMPNLAGIGLAITLAAGLLLILGVSGKAAGSVNLWLWFFGLFAVGLFFVLVFFAFKAYFYFSCLDDGPEVHIAGLWLKKQARYVLKGEVDKLTGEYILHKRLDGTLDIPNGAKDYFCRTQKNADFVWSEWSVIATQILATVLFWLGLTLLPLSLFAASTALNQPDLEVKDKSITLPADILFAFDSDVIRSTAAASLADAAATIRTRKISRARIEGHTDGIGETKRNQELSIQRANAVKAWLTGKEGLGKVNFDTLGYGAGRPVAREKTDDGKDDPLGRAKNRRVEIQLVQ